jgi:hypothetical protein
VGGTHPAATLPPLSCAQCRGTGHAHQLRATAGSLPPPTLLRAPPQHRRMPPIPDPQILLAMTPLKDDGHHRRPVFPAPLFFTLELTLYSSTPPPPFDLLFIAGDQRATAMLKSRKAPPPTAPFGELPPRRLLFLGWHAPHLPLSTSVL